MAQTITEGGGVEKTGGKPLLYHSDFAFAARLASGRVVAWGDAGFGGAMPDAQAALLTGLDGNPAISIASTGAAFAALHADGALTVWGDAISGGDEEQPTAGVKAELAAASVEAVYATKYAFAAKLGADAGKPAGGVLAWGDPMAGGDLPLGTEKAIRDAGGVTQVASTTQAFAVLASDGSIHTWGDANFGGTTVAVDPLPKAVALYSTQYAFAARLESGGVVAWGDANNGGYIPPAKAALLSNIVAIYANAGAFVAIAADGRVVTWGDDDAGGDSSAVASKLVNVKSISHSGSAFTAMCRASASA